jgi:hypothetical protein
VKDDDIALISQGCPNLVRYANKQKLIVCFKDNFNVSGCPHVTGKSIFPILTGCLSLMRLYLAGCTNITDIGMSVFSQ